MTHLERSIAARELESVPRIATLCPDEEEVDGEIDSLSDDELLGRVERTAARAREVMVETIRYLTEIERRGLHLKMGRSSLYKFCLVVLGMSEDQAYRHINAVRLAQRYPVILPMLECGELHLAALALVKKHLNAPEDEWLIHAVAGKSKREVQKILATYFPQSVFGPMQRIQFLNGDMVRLEVVIERSTLELLEKGAAMMAHQHPAQTLAFVIRASVLLLIAQLQTTRFGESSRPQKKPRPASPEHVTRAARRETFQEAEHQCTFVSEEGIRCDGEAFLEIDHRTPRAEGGTSDTANLRVLCRAHNQYEAGRILGDDRIHLARSRREREREREQQLEREGEREQQLEREREQEYERKREQEREGAQAREQELAQQEEKEAARKDATNKLEFALRSMGFHAAKVRTAVKQFVERHPDDNFTDLASPLRELLRIMTTG